MKQGSHGVVLAVCVAVFAGIASGAVYLNKPLRGPGWQRGGYQFQWSGWQNCRFGANQIDMSVMPVGGGPCHCVPYARVIDIGPFSVIH